jgi:hypothetical protein
MKRIRTTYSHLFDPDGRQRAKPCSGLMEIVCNTSRVYVCCDTCGYALPSLASSSPLIMSNRVRSHGRRPYAGVTRP